ncbi:MAG: clan AA aspartic protease [Planctomycetes bacterium]|nr:clan AA aspartic protease [Planctomycetota bacterium]
MISLEAIGTDQSPVFLSAVLDTGFNGFLTLPIDMLNALQASSAGTRRAELGDGNLVELDVYLVKINWRDEEHEVLALRADATPLVGMSLLWGSRVKFEAQDGGKVTIDRIK